MFLAKKFPAYFCLLLILLFFTSEAGYAATPTQFNITVTKKGPGNVSPLGKALVEKGQDKTFTFQPDDDTCTVSAVKVDGKSIVPTGSYTFKQVSVAHTLNVIFAKKTFEMRPVNQNHQMGSLFPSKTFMAPHGSKQPITAKPKKGYSAILRVDGATVKIGLPDKPVSYTQDDIKEPHSYGVLFEASDNKPVEVDVSVKATDPNGLTLHYRWKVSEGSIEDVDADTTKWTLPTGPGVHFANVLVYNENGGYTARRIAVVSDNLGTSSPSVKEIGQDFEPTTTFGKIYAHDSVFMVAEATDVAKTTLLTRFIYLNDNTAGIATYDGLPLDSQGRYIAHLFGGYLTYPFSMFADTHPNTNSPLADHIVGSVRLEDGSLCGTDDKFHGVDVTAKATALDKDGNELTGAVKANAYGDYALPWLIDIVKIKVECESAPPVYVNANALTTRIAEKAVFLKTGQPIITPKATSMTAKIKNRNVGIFLPPELDQPSDSQPSGDKFLGFKGMETQQQACQYYKNIGAVQNCDDQGNPSGTVITFDDWKRKMQMDPYVKAGAKDVEATYVNRIDLNLTRRHHAISYDDQPGAVSVSAGSMSSCVLKADKTVACWGSNYYNSPPDGSFKQISTGHGNSCGIKSEDNAVVCWDDNSATPTDSFSQIDTGNYYNCGIKSADNTLACWGSIDQATVPSGSFSQISVGSQYGCGINTNGALVCWGVSGPATIPVSPDDRFIQVSAGQNYTCAIKSDESLICWNNVDGIPLVNPPPEGSFRQISVGGEHSCGLKTNDTLACWGNNFYGQSTPPSGSFSDVSAGSAHTCGVKTDGAVVCWGRNNESQSSPPDFKHRVAAYVCNHLGPKNSTRGALEWAISNALTDRNQVACVAMDYQAHNGGNPYVRFYVFNANGQLNLSINLDGRQEKYVPGTCIACHGGDKYDGHYPANSNGSPDVGAHFLPYDVGNFLFSARPGFTKADQQAAIHQLNNIVLQTNPTAIERTLINAWYQSGTDILDENYWPDDWKAMAPAAEYIKFGDDFLERVYKDVNARYCRTCHVAINRDGMHTGGRGAFDNPEYIDGWYDQTVTPLSVCGKLNLANPERKSSSLIRSNHSMPNSLVTFNLLWNDAHAVSLLRKMLGDDCAPDNPDPDLGVR